MKMKLSIAMAAVLSLVLLGCGADAGLEPSNGSALKPSIGGTQLILTIDELTAVSDLIVRGSPTDQVTMQKNPAQSPDYPEGLVSRDRDVMQEIKQVSFRVDEYYKGEGPESISIMMDAALTDPAVRAISLQEGVSYVLFLFQPDSAEGKAYWNQGYLIQGIQQGVWEVNGDVAVRAVGSERSLELNQFEDLPLTPAPKE